MNWQDFRLLLWCGWHRAISVTMPRRYAKRVLPPEQVVQVIREASQDHFFRCRFNAEVLDLPRNTLMTMRHCIHPSALHLLHLWVETAHLQWLKERLTPGDVFLDVGASTGAMTLPLARAFGGDVHIVAFEPARPARALLLAALARNRLANVEVVPCAVSAVPGTTQFAEYGQDDTDACPFRPETSAIFSQRINRSLADVVDVEVTTLDEFTRERPDTVQMRVMKIDVEGFEAQVLDGASAYLSRVRPHIAIDIHADPFEDGTTTEASVRARLTRYGYSFENRGHVLLCTPPAGGDA